MRTEPERQRRTPTSSPSEARRRNFIYEYSYYHNHEHHDDKDQPRYVISVAAQILGVHPQTLRLYEREGLVEPKRTGGKIRLYSERDLERIRCIMRLTNDLGVNLAGAEAILNMRERILHLREEFERMRMRMEAEIEELRRQLDIDIHEV
jgi:MerR family transcriptional regulator/heat shock protein HspR